MASQKDYLSINQVMATLHAENESELDSDSSSGIEEETDASADEFQASSTCNVDPCFQDSMARNHGQNGG